MLPFFRILSYSFFKETKSWVSDRFINEFMSVASSLDNGKYLSVSALLCTSSHFPNPHGPWIWDGRTVTLRQSRRAITPSFIEIGTSESSINNALLQMSYSILVDIVDNETRRTILEGCCVADATRGHDIEVVTTDDMVKRLLEKR